MVDEDYLSFLRTDLTRNLRPGSVKTIHLEEFSLIKDIVYSVEEAVSPIRDVIIPFYLPSETKAIKHILLNIYFSGLQIMDYPLNSQILYLPTVNKGNPYYKNGVFLEFEKFFTLEAGTGADGSNYYWDRTFVKFNVSSLFGMKLKTCNLLWTLAIKKFGGSGPNAQHSMVLHAIDDYGQLDKDDWDMAVKADYGNVNIYTDIVGLVYSKDVKTRVQYLIDNLLPYSCFRFKSSGEPTDKSNANNYHINDPLLYCELEEDTTSKVELYADDGKGFGNMLDYFIADKEEMDLTRFFTGTGKKQIKFKSAKARRINVLIRIGMRSR